ncbi:SIGMA FACTOR BINDING PROTEIN 1 CHLOROPLASTIC [Salix viminalis]|uniref:SIGMA FACTOR BINDING PROTEIN 1 CHLOROPLASTIC n=1 Tax=Salix viminalis TaxID=40686 RepID=A0A9Q0V4Q5_SALVM|nr:SIGMA FACTOR BINDING PROTEIN 1 CHLOROPLASTIC [Salix viminalis]
MDNNHRHLVSGGVQGKKASKITKTKKKSTLKVVYISNPMKFKASNASEFMALVQKLTGQDSELPNPSMFVDSDGHDHGVGGNYQMVPNASKTVVVDGGGGGGGGGGSAQEVPVDDPSREQPERQDAPFESFDDVFMPQMLEDISETMPSGLWYEAYSWMYS